MKPFLKWAGNKFRIIHRIKAVLADSGTLIEPFVGSGAVFLNTQFKRSILGDCNKDLINLYQFLQQEQHEFIQFCQQYFVPDNNNEQRYYQFREQFNQTDDPRIRAALFVYFNKHGYNGLCRYNSKGHFNVPFGHYNKAYFPQREMEYFIDKAKGAHFVIADFTTTMQQAKAGDLIYCDPPYVPLSKTAHFTQYQALKFAQPQHEQLAELAMQLADRGVAVVISNHETPYTRELYQQAEVTRFMVQRNISCDGALRTTVPELLAVFKSR